MGQHWELEAHPIHALKDDGDADCAGGSRDRGLESRKKNLEGFRMEAGIPGLGQERRLKGGMG